MESWSAGGPPRPQPADFEVFGNCVVPSHLLGVLHKAQRLLGNAPPSVLAPMPRSAPLALELPGHGIVTGNYRDWEVVHDRVVLREVPRIDAKALRVMTRGTVLYGLAQTVDSAPWVRLDSSACRKHGIKAECAWVLADGASVGLGELLREQPMLLSSYTRPGFVEVTVH